MSLVFADKAKQVGSTAYTPCPLWETFRVDEATILYEPNVYQGDGTENRVNICVSSAFLVAKMQEYEKQLDGNVCTCIKERDGDTGGSCNEYYKSTSHVKAKLFWDRVKFFDCNNERVPRPPKLAGYTCNVICAIKGKWNSHGQQGLSLEVTDIQLIEPREQECKSPCL